MRVSTCIEFITREREREPDRESIKSIKSIESVSRAYRESVSREKRREREYRERVSRESSEREYRERVSRESIERESSEREYRKSSERVSSERQVQRQNLAASQQPSEIDPTVGCYYSPYFKSNIPILSARGGSEGGREEDTPTCCLGEPHTQAGHAQSC